MTRDEFVEKIVGDLEERGTLVINTRNATRNAVGSSGSIIRA